MARPQWLQALAKSWFASGSKKGRKLSNRRASDRPAPLRIEHLEDRLAPTANLLKDINPGSGNSTPTILTNVNGTMYFSASDGATGQELWKSDGTAAGTVLVKDISAGSS